ncbi:MAG: hypothetical protein WCG98_00675 [bacterium]
MPLENVNQEELAKQLETKGIDLKDIPENLIQKHLDEVKNTIEDPEKLVENITAFIDATWQDHDNYA